MCFAAYKRIDKFLPFLKRLRLLFGVLYEAMLGGLKLWSFLITGPPFWFDSNGDHIFQTAFYKARNTTARKYKMCLALGIISYSSIANSLQVVYLLFVIVAVCEHVIFEVLRHLKMSSLVSVLSYLRLC